MDDQVSEQIKHYLNAERATGPLPDQNVAFTAVGTLAGARLRDESFKALLDNFGMRVHNSESFSDLTGLVGSALWDVALILSPFKAAAPEVCTSVSPGARVVGAVDTIVRHGGAVIGYNVDLFAIQMLLRVLTGTSPPERALVIGSGVVARCALVSIATVFPGAHIGVVARSPERALAASRRVGLGSVVPAAGEFGASLIVHATAAGERHHSDALELDVADVFRPGVRLLDANTQFSALQQSALEAGAIVAGGSYLQHLCNLLRVALVRQPGATP